MVERINRVYSRLQDSESRMLFDARLKYARDRSTVDFFDTVGRMYDDWYSPQLNERLSALKTREIVLFGSGYVASITKRLLSHWGHSVAGVCDVNRVGELLDGVEIIAIDKAVRKYQAALFVVASHTYRKEMYEELLKHNVPAERILLPRYKYLQAVRGKQYLDVFPVSDSEIYVDAGTYDGQSVLEFVRWAGGKHKKTYAFEPMSRMCEIARQRIHKSNVSNVEVLNYAAWDKREELLFEADGAGSHMAESGVDVVQAIDIDSVVKDEQVTFIKMDVEGSELQALRGARKTIINNRPRLAICVYHKPEDVVELGNYILDLVPEYRMYIRHYASNVWETVLYAVP